MVCPYCASTNIVTIKGQSFCVNCGHPQPTVKPAGADEAQAAVDLQLKKVLVKPASQTQSPTIVTGPKSARVMSDIKSPPKPTPKPEKPPTPAKVIATPHHHKKDLAPKDEAETKVKAESKSKSHPKATAVHSTTKLREAKRIHGSIVVTTSNLAIGLVLALKASSLLLLVHQSHSATPGTFLAYLAGLSPRAKYLIVSYSPATLIALFGLFITLLWLRTSAIVATSRLYDHRPISHRLALKMGWNALGSVLIVVLAAIGAMALWLGSLAGVIYYLSHWSLNSNIISGLGVAASFVWVLWGLYLSAALIMTAYLIILSAQSLRSAFAIGLGLARRCYVTLAASLIWLSFITLAVFASVGVVVLVLHDWLKLGHHPYYLQVMVLFGLSWLASFWLLGLILDHWVKQYRNVTYIAFGDAETAAFRAGRKPKPIHPWGIAITITWWLIVAAGASWALWRLRVDPTPLLVRLSNTIY
ncbi:MAG TPA: hypothetical protein VLE72_04245 [Candidatus Saccharimonadales bacterium]|nr:hypothetical protein [Candidatus Saccharimonadales bacterium]